MAAKLFALLMMLLSLGREAVNEYADQMSLGGNLFLVNRDYAIASDYVPSDLVAPDVDMTTSNQKMRAEAAQALEDMFRAAKEEKGYKLVAVSGYRSYGQQTSIFNRKVDAVGKKAAMLLVAPPGTSEHQLGLAMDIGCKKNTSLTGSFGKTDEGKWVAENCHRFGFIIRYKEEWTDITGYSYEPWHVRYVGREHAEMIYQMDIPLEYYVAQLREAQYALMIYGGT
ncbi:MAG: D-alanyl-D-alanine carboxypeptidase family protein [Clostridiales bacterium]|nr:D-alanyl-D-alanine carboxypeptidase family protein [Clostridiales bacterium]